jgi:short-subunit dehydrogenase
MRFESLLGRVVVVTGASSGIGKLAAERLLAEGAKVVLTARDEEEMRNHLQSLGVGDDRAIVVGADVSDYGAVQYIAQRAQEHFKGIDVWINNAATNVYGLVEELSVDDIRRVIDVNLMGQIHGMKVALDVFNQQGYGNIINVSSVFGVVSAPLEAAYAASKHGILGFSCALREEMMTERYAGKQIDVIDILPASMDTPLSIHAKSKTGRLPKPMPPVYDPAITVDAIVRHAKRPQSIVVVGRSGKLITMMGRLFPTWTERYLSKTGISQQQTNEPKPLEGHDNLYQPMPGTNQVEGGFRAPASPVGRYAKDHPIQLLMLLLIPGLLLTRWWFSAATKRQKTPWWRLAWAAAAR